MVNCWKAKSNNRYANQQLRLIKIKGDDISKVQRLVRKDVEPQANGGRGILVRI